jgi:hypothetical protein
MYSDEHFSDKDDFGAETFEAYNPPLEEITASCDNCGKSFPADMGRGTGQADSRIYFGNGKEIGYTSRDKRISGHEPNRKPILSCKECWEPMTDYEWNPPASLFDAETFDAESNLSEATLKRLRRTYDTYEDTNQHTANYLLLATFFGTDAEKDEVKKIMKRRDRRGYLTQEESDWMYKNINNY